MTWKPLHELQASDFERYSAWTFDEGRAESDGSADETWVRPLGYRGFKQPSTTVFLRARISTSSKTVPGCVVARLPPRKTALHPEHVVGLGLFEPMYTPVDLKEARKRKLRFECDAELLGRPVRLSSDALRDKTDVTPEYLDEPFGDAPRIDGDRVKILRVDEKLALPSGAFVVAVLERGKLTVSKSFEVGRPRISVALAMFRRPGSRGIPSAAAVRITVERGAVARVAAGSILPFPDISCALLDARGVEALRPRVEDREACELLDAEIDESMSEEGVAVLPLRAGLRAIVFNRTGAFSDAYLVQHAFGADKQLRYVQLDFRQAEDLPRRRRP